MLGKLVKFNKQLLVLLFLVF